MKKLFVMFAGLFILAACQQQQPAPAAEETPAQETKAQEPTKVDEKWLTYEVFDTNSMPDNTPMPAVLVPEQEQPCTIKGYDCREVIAKLTLTTEEPANEEVANGETPYWNVPGGTKYVNPALDEMGMKITQYVMYRDGGTTQYVIDDNVGINTNLRLGDNPDYGKVIVKFKDGDTFTFRPAEPIQPQTPVAVEEQSAGEQPVQEQPVAEQPVQEQPVAEQAQPVAQVQNDGCQIKGYACLDVIQKLGQIQEVRTPKENPTEEDIWTPDIITYENPALDAMGIKVTFYTMYRDGGSKQYVLDDEVSVRTNNAIAAPETEKGVTTVKFKNNDSIFKYASDGTLLK